MTDELITVPLETAQRLFDALVNSMDFGSGFLESDDVTALRGLAVAIGVDPNTGTPGEFRSQYPHPFRASDNPYAIRQMFGMPPDEFEAVHNDDGSWTTQPRTWQPPFVPCEVGQWARWCAKAETDPMHHGGAS